MIQPDAGRPRQVNKSGSADRADVAAAVAWLRAGEPIGLPTETVYGLAADALNATALARIFEIKQRPLFNPLILHEATAERAFALAQTVPSAAGQLAERFWPGPLTLVLPKRAIVPELATSGLPYVALRVPAHPVAQAVLAAFGGPLAAPSANRFGRISPTDAAAVAAELGSAVRLILDGGSCPVGLESTILDLSGTEPRLLRAGGIGLEELEECLGQAIARPPSAADAKPVAPGQLRSHYAPARPFQLLNAWSELPELAGTGCLAFGSTPPLVEAAAVVNISPSGDLREAAANFFRALRGLDDDPAVRRLAALRLPKKGLGLAINERLERAAAPRPGQG